MSSVTIQNSRILDTYRSELQDSKGKLRDAMNSLRFITKIVESTDTRESTKPIVADLIEKFEPLSQEPISSISPEEAIRDELLDPTYLEIANFAYDQTNLNREYAMQVARTIRAIGNSILN